jgi:hypothetical protein
MWIMGLRDEFRDAVKSIKGRHFNATKVRPSASIYFSKRSTMTHSLITTHPSLKQQSDTWAVAYPRTLSRENKPYLT